MAAILSWIITLFSLMPARILSVLGFGWLTYQGYKAALDSVISNAIQNVTSLPFAVYSLLSMSGFITAFGIVLAAASAKAAIMFIDHLAKL